MARLVSLIMFSYIYTSGVFKHNEDDAVAQDGPKIKLQTLVHILTKC